MPKPGRLSSIARGRSWRGWKAGEAQTSRAADLDEQEADRAVAAAELRQRLDEMELTLAELRAEQSALDKETKRSRQEADELMGKLAEPEGARHADVDERSVLCRRLKKKP